MFRICGAKKAIDVIILDMRKLSGISEYFLIASGESTVQTKALASAILEMLKKKKIKIYNDEGYKDGKWIVLDAGRFIIHLFLSDARRFYNLELLWLDAPRVEV